MARPDLSRARTRAVITLLLISLAGCGQAGDATVDGVQGIDPPPRAVPGLASWAPWPSALHDARHSGSSTGVGPQAGRIVWSRHLSDSPVAAGPVVGANDTAYLVDPAGTLHALDLHDGHDRWTADVGASVSGDLSLSPLILPDGTVVAATARGLGGWSSDGRQRWSVTLDESGTASSPISADGRRIYVGSSGGSVSAVDVAADHASARIAWELDTRTGHSYASVVTDGRGRIYSTSSDLGLVAVDDRGDRASVAWTRSPDGTLVEVSPGLSADGVALLGTNGEAEFAFDHEGQQQWMAPRKITYASPSVTEDGLAYVGEHDNQVHVFHVRTGHQVGRYPTRVGDALTQAQVWTSVVVDRQHNAYFGTRLNYLIGVGADGHRLFTLDLGASTASYPALTGDGRLLIATDDGDVVLVR